MSSLCSLSGRSDWKNVFASSVLLSVSRWRRSRLGMTPSYVVSYVPSNDADSYSTPSFFSYPNNTMFCTSLGRVSQDLCILNPASFATASRIFIMYPILLAEVVHGWIAPSARESLGLGTSVPSSTCRIVPSPWQVLQAPWGELKEKLGGSCAGSQRPGGPGRQNLRRI